MKSRSRCLEDLLPVALRESKLCGFDKFERHEVGNVYRTAYSNQRCHLHALNVARQYVKEEIDKNQRRGYK